MAFDKLEYNRQYVKDNRDQIRLSVSKTDKEAFDRMIADIGVKQTPYIIALVNADAKARGLEPPFKTRKEM